MTDLDEALQRFQMGQLEYAGGLSNHGPMAVEALVQLGHASLVPGFCDLYAPRLGSFTPRGRPIADADRAAALGRIERFEDWVATYECALDDAPWTEVVAREVPPLLAGLFGGATHGWLRTAHAVRALGEEETEPRRRELAFGLAYWAGRHQRLPGDPGGTARDGAGTGLDPEAALAGVAPLPPDRRRPGFFFDAVRVLDGDAGFEAAVKQVGVPAAGLDAWVGRLCRAAARLYLANPGARVAYVHTVTAPSALRWMAPLLDEASQTRAALSAFHCAAALHAISGANEAPRVDEEVAKLAESTAEIRYRAACSLEEHAIKMSEACLREDRLHPDPALRLAAADAALRLAPDGARLC